MSGKHVTGASGESLPSDGGPLGLDPEEMRRLGYWVVDQVVGHVERMADGPAIREASPADLRRLLGGPPPEEGGDPLEEMKTLVEVALAHMQHGDHPRYFARVPGPSSYAGILGDWLGTGFNAIAASWSGGAGPATLELVTLDWLRALLGLPDGTEGVMTSGGSAANMTALAAARAVSGPGVCYLSDQAHASILRALRVLGFPSDHIRVLPSDERYRLAPAAVAASVAEDKAAGRRPGFVIASAGTTNTGAVDPFPQLAELCRAEGLWLHVDGAYGAAAGLCEAGRRALAGLELADSLVVDPHKWLFQPYDLGCVLVRRAGVLEQAFRMSPDYLADVVGHDDEVDLRDRGLELTRRGRGLKLWLTFRVYGVRRLAAAVERGIVLAEYAQSVVETDPAWEVVTQAQLGIVTFAPRACGQGPSSTGERQSGEPEDLHDVAAAVARDGFAAVTSTRLHGREVLRLCTINPRTTHRDIDATLERLGLSPRTPTPCHPTDEKERRHA